MPYGPAAHHSPVPEFGFGTYRAFPGAPFGAAAPDPWGSPWGGAGPFGPEAPFGLEPEPVLMFFDAAGLGTPGPAAAPGGQLTSLLPEVLSAVRTLPEVAAGQRETGETLKEVLQRLDMVQRQVEALHTRLGAVASRAAE